jgi:hypothetical protein
MSLMQYGTLAAGWKLPRGPSYLSMPCLHQEAQDYLLVPVLGDIA